MTCANYGPEEAAKDPLFANFIDACAEIVDRERCPHIITEAVARRMRALLSVWKMPDRRYLSMQPGHPYGSFLLYKAPGGAFVVIIDTFAAGQTTDVHNHRTWAVVGLLQGSELETRYTVPASLSGPPNHVRELVSKPGDIAVVQETEFHKLRTAAGTESVSFHLYGADVGRIKRLKWDETTQRYVEFQQGYSNDALSLPSYFAAPLSAEKPQTKTL